MNDKAFLRYALEQSFKRPSNCAADRMALHYDTETSGGYAFIDKIHQNIVPYFMPFSTIKKYTKAVAGGMGRNNMRLYDEYNAYKHDLAENIIIPEHYAEVAKARQVLDLVAVNRQSAQKKKIVATLIPAKFTLQMKETGRQYDGIMYAVNQVLQKNQGAVNLALIKEFEQAYTAVMRKFRPAHPFYLLNRKRMLYYLNEAAQILKSNHPLDEDFCLTHCFYDVNFIGKNVSKACGDMLRKLVAYMQKMAHQPQLLTLAQMILADRKKYSAALKNYETKNNVVDAARILSIRRDAQKLFEKYALLCYLDGVRFAFENKFLNECPEPRHPPLPTVAPQEELKKIADIVEQSYKIDASAGNIGQLYLSALKSYEQEFKQLSQLIKTDN